MLTLRKNPDVHQYWPNHSPRYLSLHIPRHYMHDSKVLHNDRTLLPTYGTKEHAAGALWICFISKLRISRGLSRYSPMSEVFAPRYLAGLVSTHG